MGARFEFRILGPLEVRIEGAAVRIAGARQRALLALLLCNANRVVSRDQLIEELLGGQSVDSADRMLRVQVSRLRSALPTAGAEPRLIAQPPGYLLRIEPGELDLHEFERLVTDGRAALERDDPREAAVLFGEAESLWRGRPLADLEFEPLARLEVRRLEELRQSAVEDRIDAELALGRHTGLCAELEALVGEHPLRERLRCQLMLALYRCGRQAEALAIYRAGRQLLVDELAIEPSPQLKRLEQAILRQDESLELGVEPTHAIAEVAVLASPEPAALPDEPRPAVSVARRRRPPWLAGGLVLAALVGGSAAVLWRTGGSARPMSAFTANSVAAISPAGNAITAVVRVGFSPSAVASGAGAVWVSDYSGGTVERIDAVTHAVQVIQAGSAPSGLAVGGGAVWVTNNLGGTVSRIDPTVGRVVQTTSVGNGPSGLAIGDGAVWVANGSDGTLTRIDAVTGAVQKTIALGGGATDVAVGFGAVWVSDEANGRVLRIDPQTNQVTQSVNVNGGPSAIAVGDGSVWVANSLDGTVSRIDPQSNRVAATITVGNGPGAIVVGAGGVWVANEFGANVVRVDPSSESVARTVTVGNRPRGLALAGGLVWVGAQASAAAHRGGTMTVLQNAQFGSIDPARAGSLASALMLYMTNDGLTAFKRVGGADGAQVVPDLAVSLPTPIDGGLTYTFQLRSGIRYSNGQRVMPEDFRRAIERDLKLGPGAPTPPYYTYYENIVGGAECVSRPSHCDLSRGIVPDDRRNSIIFHLVHPDPEFPAKLALWTAAAAAPGAPGRDIGNHPLPATGPYEVSTVTPRVVTLVRNPYFHEWSHAAQPDGYPDRIVWRIGGSIEAAVSAVERGAADYTLDAPPADRLGEVQTRFAGQLNVNPNDVTIAMGLNTRAPPFTDVRVRRALSYALDRGRLAQLLGQDSHPTCQLLPPYILGYQRYCPYTLNPNTAGEWSAPDLGKARALIAASGSRGTPVTIWSQPAYMTDFTATGQYLASLLSRLGYPTHIKTFSVNDPSFPIRLSDSRTTPQAFLGAVVPNYPSPSEFLGPQLESCQSFIPNSPSNNNLTGFCDRRFDSTVSAALAAEAAGSPNAAQLWAKADREFTDQAPILAFVTPSTTDFVSQRVGNYQYNPQLGVLIDQLWVR